MISVIIPAYNTPPAWLVESLGSLQNQRYRDWEAIITDDASRESIRSSVPEWITADTRFRFLRHEHNRGVAAARNSAVKAASGDFLFMLDPDDALEDDALALLLDRIVANPHVDCVYSDFKVFGAVSGIRKLPAKEMKDMLIDHWIPGPGVLMRRALFERAGGYCEDEAFRAGNEDWDFWLSCTEAGFQALHLAQALYRYRVSPSSLSNSPMKRRYFETTEALYARHRKLIDDAGERERFLFAGYLFSIKRCRTADLSLVLRRGILHSRSLRNLADLVLETAKRIMKPLINPLRMMRPDARALS